METEKKSIADWSRLQIEPSDGSSCESCGLPGHSLRRVPDWPSPGSHPSLGAVAECSECREKIELYAPDEYTSRPLCGTCYGQARSRGFFRELQENQKRLGLFISDDLHVTPAVAYKISGIPWCCSISCLECVLFGPGHCRECGTRLGEKTKSFGKVEYEYRAGMKFCDVCSQKKRQEHNLGERLLVYLRKYEPSLVGPKPERKKRAPNRAYIERLNLPKSPTEATYAL